MADGLHRPYFDAPPNETNDPASGDRRRRTGMLASAAIAAVSALALAGLIDRGAGRSGSHHATVIDRGAVAGLDRGGADGGDRAALYGDSVSDDPAGRRTPTPTDEPQASAVTRAGHGSTSVASERPTSSMAGDVGTTTERHQQTTRSPTPAPTPDPDSSDTEPTTSARVLTTYSAPASTAALESSTSAKSVRSESSGRPDDTVGDGADGERDVDPAHFRRFVADAGLDTVDYVTPHLAHGTMVTEDQRVNVLILDHLQTPGIRVSPGHRAPDPVGAWATRIGAQAAINANWFSSRGGFDGPFVSGGTVYGGPDHHYTALFGFTVDKRLVTEHHSVVNDTVDEQVVEAVAGHPTLVDRGRVTADFGGDPTFTKRHPRTAIGAAHGGDIVIFVTIDGRSSRARGTTGAETAVLMSDLGASHAVMLDGGGSSAMWIEDRGVVNNQSDPGRRVGNQIAIFGR